MSALAGSARPTRIRGPLSWWRDPWRRPRLLQGLTFAYIAWTILPVVIAIAFSFNAGRSRSSWQGLSVRWWVGDPYDSLWRDADLKRALLQTFLLATCTVVIAVPIGTAFAIGIDRWHGRISRVADFTMLLQFVVPELILSIALFLMFTTLLELSPGQLLIPLGTRAQIIGLVTFQLSYSVIIVRARLLSIGPEYEEAAMDLGARPGQAIRRVLLPLLSPAILASMVRVFADSVDDFVTVRYLSGDAASQPLSVKIYSAARSSPTPAVNAAATVMLSVTLLFITVGWFTNRRLNRGEKADAVAFTGGI